MDKFEALEKKMCQELEAIETQIKSGGQMSVQDLDKIDKLTHAMKSLRAYKKMLLEEEYGMEDGMSGRRNPYNGRYMDAGPHGYSGGYGYPPMRW